MSASARVVMNLVLLLIEARLLLSSIFCICSAVGDILSVAVLGFDDVGWYAVLYRVFSLSKKAIAGFDAVVLIVELISP